MIHDVIMWWWAVGSILVALGFFLPDVFTLADVEAQPTLKVLPTWALCAAYWTAAMVIAFFWPVIVVRVLKRVRGKS